MKKPVSFRGLTSIQRSFPGLNRARFGSKDRVGAECFLLRQFRQQFRIADFEFFQKMPGLILQLSAGHGECLQTPRDFQKLRAIEVVMAIFCFIGHVMKISPDRDERIFRFTKPNQLWMGFVAPRFSRQHFLRKQAFSPQSDQALAIQIAGMNRPKSQAYC